MTKENQTQPEARPGRFKKTAMTLLKISLFFLIALFLLSTLPLEQISQINQFVLDSSVVFLLLRWAVFITLMVYWQSAIAWLAHKKQWSQQHHNRITNNRWQVIVLFMVLELIFNHRSYLSFISGV